MNDIQGTWPHAVYVDLLCKADTSLLCLAILWSSRFHGFRPDGVLQ